MQIIFVIIIITIVIVPIIIFFLNQKKHPAKGIVSAVIAVSLLAA